VRWVLSTPLSGPIAISLVIQLPDLPGLRSWPLRRFPYLIFFIEREEHIDVWRMLHDQRDIPAWMQDG
jgi:hypothetical protein